MPSNYGQAHKWTKRSIFWDLPYWRRQLIRHNLDVMHIEKNVFDAVFGTLMDLQGKTKDNLKSRQDIHHMCDRPKIAIDPESCPNRIPKAVYNLTTEQQQAVMNWMKELKFPDGYASNIGRCVHADGRKISGMKSHDCHVFMQRLLPIAFKEMLPAAVWNAITELSLLFRCLCSAMLDITQLRKLVEQVPLILCNLEKVFPPSFFDAMEHVVIHLPEEALIAGPVQFRWMYPFERYFSLPFIFQQIPTYFQVHYKFMEICCSRFLKQLKKTIGNKARVEGSICEAYIAHEITLLVQNYAQSSIHCRMRKSRRHDEGANVDGHPQFSIFNYPSRFQGKQQTRWLEQRERNAAHLCELRNCPEVQPILE